MANVNSVTVTLDLNRKEWDQLRALDCAIPESLAFRQVVEFLPERFRILAQQAKFVDISCPSTYRGGVSADIELAFGKQAAEETFALWILATSGIEVPPFYFSEERAQLYAEWGLDSRGRGGQISVLKDGNLYFTVGGPDRFITVDIEFDLVCCPFDPKNSFAFRDWFSWNWKYISELITWGELRESKKRRITISPSWEEEPQ